MQSSYEFPGRYARWSLGFVDPPLVITGRGLECTIEALNSRGKVLLPAVRNALEQNAGENGFIKSLEACSEGGNTGDELDSAENKLKVRVVDPPSTCSLFKVGTDSLACMELLATTSLFSLNRSSYPKSVTRTRGILSYTFRTKYLLSIKTKETRGGFRMSFVTKADPRKEWRDRAF